MRNSMIARNPYPAILLAIALSTASVGFAGPANKLPDEILNLIPEQIIEPLKPYKATYPPEAKPGEDRTTVWLKIIISSDGKVRKADVIYCSNPGSGFEKAAWKAVRKSRFPGSLVANDSPFRDWLYTRVVFGDESESTPESETASSSGEGDGKTRSADFPELIYRGVPEYPPKAIHDKIEGRVMIEAVVGMDGSVISAKVLESFEKAEKYGFHDAALKAARECKFKPLFRDGKPVECTVSFPYEFKLSL